MPLLLVIAWGNPNQVQGTAGSTISPAQAMVPRGYRVGQTAELITALSNEQLWAHILLC